MLELIQSAYIVDEFAVSISGSGREAQESRKKNKPENNAVDIAAAMGIDILTVKQYRELQKHGEFDTKTSSWVKTPLKIRRLGGAIFCDRRYDTVFVYHNGAETYMLQEVSVVYLEYKALKYHRG